MTRDPDFRPHFYSNSIRVPNRLGICLQEREQLSILTRVFFGTR